MITIDSKHSAGFLPIRYVLSQTIKLNKYVL